MFLPHMLPKHVAATEYEAAAAASAAAARIEDADHECMHIKALQTEHKELKNKEKARQRIIKATGAETIHLYHLAFENF
jgi:ribosomal protein L18E